MPKSPVPYDNVSAYNNAGTYRNDRYLDNASDFSEGSRTKRKKKKSHPIRKTLKYLFLILLILAALAGFKLLPTFQKYYKEAVKTVAASDEGTFSPDTTTTIYDKNDHVIAQLSDGNRQYHYLNSDEIPDNVKKAFIAVEDRSFYTNKGYDVKGIIRAGTDYILSKGKNVTGASTITQQLAKNTFLTRERTVTRKAKEILIASELTKKYSKDKILEYYINDVYFANNIYGIEEASQKYFGKPASELSLSQTAYLCSIPNRPEYYNPWKNPDHALTRRDKILRNMYDCGYISESELDNALNETITVLPKQEDVAQAAVDPASQDYQTSYAVYCAAKELMREEGFEFRYSFKDDADYQAYETSYQQMYSDMRKSLYTQKYDVHTSLDPDVQAKAQAALDNVLSSDKEKSDAGVYALQGAATVIDNDSGKVTAIIGGRTQDGVQKNQSFNRAFQSKRQPGSTFKPLVVYGPAIETGKYDANSTLTSINISRAKKSSAISKMSGRKISLENAVVTSDNGAAYWLENEIGVNYGVGYTKNLGFSDIVPEDYTLSAALGGLTYGASTEEMAGAYSTFANDGFYSEPTCITSIKDNVGTELYKKPDDTKVYSDSTVKQMTDIMKQVLTRGTAKTSGWNQDVIAAAGKTGTTNQNKDGWFCGYTPYYTVSVWVGYDDSRSTSKIWGYNMPVSIWTDTMNALDEGKNPAQFTFSNDDIAPITTKISYANDPVYPYYFPDEKIKDDYTVEDARDDAAKENSIKAEARTMKGLPSDEEKTQYFADHASEIFDIKDEQTKQDALNSLKKALDQGD